MNSPLNWLPGRADWLGIFRVYTKYREPLSQFTRRMLHSSMRSASIGWGWLFLQPFVMMVAYVLVFTLVFKGSYGEAASDTPKDYAIAVYLSLTVFNFSTDIIGGSPFLLEMHRSLLLNTRIPAEVFIVASVQASLIRFIAGLVPCLILAALITHVHWTGIWILPLLASYTLFLLGLAFVLSVLGAILPDIRQLIALMSTVLMFSSAVFYPARQLSPWFQHINPFFQAVEKTREYVLWGRPLSAGTSGFVVELAAAGILLIAGLVLLKHFRSRLAE